MNYDAVVVGAGFSGAVTARELAEAGKQVLLLEKRPQIAGNMFDEPDTNGVLVHRYGPHIFHTNSREVYDHLSRFTAWLPYEHRVLGRIDGQYVPIPFSFRSLDLLFPRERAQAVKQKLTETFPGQSTAPVLDLMESADPVIREFGAYVFEKVFLHYTAKQWGTPPEQVDRSVINRVPVVLGYDDRYFQDAFQFMPVDGFTPLFQRMLGHPGIAVRLNCDAAERLALDREAGVIRLDGEPFSGPVVYTGPIDELFGYAFGPLPYRSLELAFSQEDCTTYQPAAVVNYPNAEAFTRITEFKQLSGQKIEGTTTLLREYPLPYSPGGARGGIPYYVIAGEENRRLYDRYAALAAGFGNLHFCGRLAEYRYYNMDAAVARALQLARTLTAR